MTNDLHLVDTSVWLQVLPRRNDSRALRARIDDLLVADRVAITGMIRLELLSGARTDEEWEHLSRLLSALHLLTVHEALWEDAARMAFQLRRKGVTVPSTDVLIGAVAGSAGAVLVHRDHHFDLMASHLPLRVESHFA